MMNRKSNAGKGTANAETAGGVPWSTRKEAIKAGAYWAKKMK